MDIPGPPTPPSDFEAFEEDVEKGLACIIEISSNMSISEGNP